MDHCGECGVKGIFRCCCLQVILCEMCVKNHIQHLVLDTSGNIESVGNVNEFFSVLRSVDEGIFGIQDLENQMNELKTENGLKEIFSKFWLFKSAYDIFDSIQPKMYFSFGFKETNGIFEYNILKKSLMVIKKTPQFNGQVVVEYPIEPAFLMFGGYLDKNKNNSFFKYDLSEDLLIKLDFYNFPEIFQFTFCVFGKFMFILGGKIFSEAFEWTGNKVIYIFSFEDSTVKPYLELETEIEVCVCTFFQNRLCVFEENKSNQIAVIEIDKIDKISKKFEVYNYTLPNVDIQTKDHDFTTTAFISATLTHIFLIFSNILYKIDKTFRATKLLVINDFYFIPNIQCLVNPEGLYYIGYSKDTDNDFKLSCLFLDLAEENEEISYKKTIFKF